MNVVWRLIPKLTTAVLRALQGLVVVASLLRASQVAPLLATTRRDRKCDVDAEVCSKMRLLALDRRLAQRDCSNLAHMLFGSVLRLVNKARQCAFVLP